jgi:hypothetical protein
MAGKVKEKAAVIKEALRVHMHKSKVVAASARAELPKGIRLRFNRFMALHRTKINMLGGLSALVIAGFFGHIIIGFIVLGIALFTAEFLSGGKE